ncbi:MAG: TolB family protein [Chroococcales cyanobacterium]
MRQILKKNKARLLMIGLMVGLNSCGNSPLTTRGFITPPTQLGNGALNTQTTEQNARFSHDGRYLVFASDRQAQRQIYLYDLRQRRLLNLPGLNQPGVFQDEPDISADGRYIVYVSEQLGKRDIFVYDRQTFQSEQVTKDLYGNVRSPTISGNGRFVAFESNRLGQWNIEIYDRGVNIDVSLPQSTPIEGLEETDQE